MEPAQKADSVVLRPVATGGCGRPAVGPAGAGRARRAAFRFSTTTVDSAARRGSSASTILVVARPVLFGGFHRAAQVLHLLLFDDVAVATPLRWTPLRAGLRHAGGSAQAGRARAGEYANATAGCRCRDLIVHVRRKTTGRELHEPVKTLPKSHRRGLQFAPVADGAAGSSGQQGEQHEEMANGLHRRPRSVEHRDFAPATFPVRPRRHARRYARRHRR